jgi:hypothetical protein
MNLILLLRKHCKIVQRRFELVTNHQTARMLGLTGAPSMVLPYPIVWRMTVLSWWAYSSEILGCVGSVTTERTSLATLSERPAM